MSANVLRVGQNRTRRSTVTYSGPDRRGVIRKLDRPVSAETAATVMVGVITVPICVATVAHALGAGLGPWSTGVADAAFVGFSIAAALLMFRWRLIGDAACVRLAATAAIIGLYFLVAATRPDTMDSGVAAALRIVSVTVIAPLTMDVLFGPEVRGDLRPVRFIVGMMAVALVGALFLGLSPARVVLQANPGGIRIVDLLAALVASVLAGMSVIEGVRRRRLLLVGLAAMLLSVGGSCTAFAVNDLGHWPSLSALFLFVGAVVFVAVVGSELQPAIDAVLIHDVHGRRRWEAAESQLTEAHSRIQVQRHDVSSMLSAIDGTLLVLTTQRDQLPAEDTDRLLVAIRDEVHVLQANLGGRPNNGRGYDLSELVETIVSVRDSGPDATPLRTRARNRNARAPRPRCRCRGQPPCKCGYPCATSTSHGDNSVYRPSWRAHRRDHGVRRRARSFGGRAAARVRAWMAGHISSKSTRKWHRSWTVPRSHRSRRGPRGAESIESLCASRPPRSDGQDHPPDDLGGRDGVASVFASTSATSGSRRGRRDVTVAFSRPQSHRMTAHENVNNACGTPTSPRTFTDRPILDDGR